MKKIMTGGSIAFFVIALVTTVYFVMGADYFLILAVVLAGSGMIVSLFGERTRWNRATFLMNFLLISFLFFAPALF